MRERRSCVLGVDLVTGGAGFIGSHLVDRLIADGRTVRVLDSFVVGRRENLRQHASNPDFALIEGDVVRVRSRAISGDPAGEGPRLAVEIHARVRAVAPGFDPYFLEAEWRRFWAASGRPKLRSPDAAFLAFAKGRAARG